MTEGGTPAPTKPAAIEKASSRTQSPPAFYRSAHLAILLVAAVAACLVPVWVSTSYGLGIANNALVYVILALGFYVLFALGGQFSLGHNVFFAVGGFSAVWMAGHSGFWVALLFATAITAALAAAFKFMLIRVGPIYFAIGTLALSQIASVVFSNWKALTGGYTGKSVTGFPTLFSWKADTPYRLYWFLLGAAVLAVLAVALLELSPLRRRFLTARDIPLVAATFGAPSKRIELLAFTIGGALAGVAGCLNAYQTGFISPSSYPLDISLLVLLMVLFGGIGSLWGPVIGAVFLTWLPYGLQSLTTHSDFVYALLVLLVLLVLPGGVTGFARLATSRLATSRLVRIRHGQNPRDV